MVRAAALKRMTLEQRQQQQLRTKEILQPRVLISGYVRNLAACCGMLHADRMLIMSHSVDMMSDN